MSRILTACAIFALAACANPQDLNGDGIVDADEKGRSPDSVSLIAPSNPIGTISGVVVNTNQAPLEGANVTLVLGNGADASHTTKVTTSADGAFVFKDVPGGSNAQILISKTGYSSARVTGFVPGATGNFPINDGNGNTGVISLAQLSSTIKFRVFTATGVPARGAKAYLEVQATAFVTGNGTYGSAVGNYSGAAEVDEAGLLSFANAPDPAEIARINSNYNFTLTIGALDLDMDGRSDFLGTLRNFAAYELFTNPDRTFILDDARTTAGLQIVATNLDSFNVPANSPPYRNALKTTDPVTIVFNQPITQVDTTRIVKVVQEDCQTNVAVSVTQRAPNVLSIAPTAAWTLGNRYNIIVRATGLDASSTVDFIGYFFAIEPNAPRPLSTSAAFQVRKATANTMSNALQPGDQLFVLFDTPIAVQGGPVARAYVNFDLNNDNMTGGMTGFGEFGGPANSGVAIANAEQLTATDPANGTFTCKRSGYSSRWSINLTTFPSTNFIPASTGMKVVFAKDNSSSDSYQTAWGSPVVADVGGTINIVP